MKNDENTMTYFEVADKELEQVAGGAASTIDFAAIIELLRKCERELRTDHPGVTKAVDNCIHYCEVKAAIAFKSEYNKLKSHYPECSYYAQIDAIIAG